MHLPRLSLFFTLLGLICLSMTGNFVPLSHGQTGWVKSAKEANVAAFLFGNRIERFDLESQTWLQRLSLPRSGATAFCITDSYLFVAYGQACYRYNSQGTGETHVLNTNYPIQALHADGDLLFLNFSISLYTYIDSVRISTNTKISSHTRYVDSNHGSVIVPSQNKIFGVTSGVSPADIVMTSYNDQGTFNSTVGSPYHGSYSIGSRVFAFPAGTKVLTSTGIVYSTLGLNYLGSFAGNVDDIDFHGEDVPVILRGNTARAFTPSMMETGMATLATGTAKIWVHNSTLFGFRPGVNGSVGIVTEAISLDVLNAPDPGEGISPVGLNFTPDAVMVDVSGNLLVLSKAHQCVFIWNYETQAWSERSYVLQNTPGCIAYSAENNSLYMSYTGGSITTLDLSLEEPEEVGFANLATTVHGLTCAGELIIAADASGAWNTHSVFSASGVLLDSRDWNDASATFAWAPSTRRLFFLDDGSSPTDLKYEVISPQGVLSAITNSPYHSSAGMLHPVRVSPDGTKVLLGSGRIFDADGDLSQVGTLSNGFMDSAWLGSSILTVRLSGGTQFQRWSGTTFGELKSVTLTGDPLFVRVLDENYYVIGSLVDGKPQMRMFDANDIEIPAPVFAIPADFLGASSNSGISLSWTPQEDATGYEVQRNLAAGSQWEVIASLPASASSFEDQSEEAAVNSRYRIVAVYGNVRSAPSGEFSLLMLLPAAPSQLQGTVGAEGVSLTWSAAAGATQYRIEKRLGTAGQFVFLTTVSSPLTEYLDLDIEPGNEYQYRIYSANSVGVSANASPVFLARVMATYSTAIYRANVSFSGKATGSSAAGSSFKPIKKALRSKETSYVAVDLASQTATQVFYWKEGPAKSKQMHYRVEPLEMEFLLIPMDKGKYQFSAMEVQNDGPLADHEGSWGRIRQIVGIAAPYKLPKTGIQYTALPTRLSGKDRFVFMGEVYDAESGETSSQFKTIDGNLTAVLDAGLSASTMTGAPLQNFEKGTLDHATHTVIKHLENQGYENVKE